MQGHAIMQDALRPEAEPSQRPWCASYVPLHTHTPPQEVEVRQSRHAYHKSGTESFTKTGRNDLRIHIERDGSYTAQ